MQRHVQNCNVNAEIRCRNSSIICFEINALIGEYELWIESRLKRPTLEIVGEESNNEPENNGTAYNKDALLQRRGGKDSTIKYKNRKLYQGNRNRILEKFHQGLRSKDRLL